MEHFWIHCTLSLVVSVNLLGTVCCDHPPKWYTVNLDDPPERRWTDVIHQHKDIITDLESVFKQYIPSFVYPYVEQLAADVDKYLPKPFASEMKGIARELNASVGQMVLENLLYDITAFCTSIVAQDDNGTIWHARNMDYHFTDMLKNNTVNINFVRGGKDVYQATTYAGYVGILTGQKPNRFTITLNERKEGEVWMNAIMFLLTSKHSLSGFLLRQTLEDTDSFEIAVHRLSTTPTVAPAYYIVGGVKPGQGVVITKSRLEADLWFIQPQNGSWYVLETNYDHWEPPPAEDDRRDACMKSMNETGQSNINTGSLYHVLSIPPVLQSITIYTTVMSAAHPSIFKTCIRDDMVAIHDGC